MLNFKILGSALLLLLIVHSNVYPCVPDSSDSDGSHQFMKKRRVSEVNDLIDAIDANDIAAIRAYKGDVNQKYSTHTGGSFTALYHAILKNRPQAVEELLAKGANAQLTYHWVPDWADPVKGPFDYYDDPLRMAAKAGNLQMVSALLKARAGIDYCPSAWMFDDHRILMFGAAEEEITNIARAFIEDAANPRYRPHGLTGNRPDPNDEYDDVLHKTYFALQEAVKKYARTAMLAFAAINHWRLGAQSPYHGLPLRGLKQIYGYLKPTGSCPCPECCFQRECHLH